MQPVRGVGHSNIRKPNRGRIWLSKVNNKNKNKIVKRCITIMIVYAYILTNEGLR